MHTQAAKCAAHQQACLPHLVQPILAGDVFEQVSLLQHACDAAVCLGQHLCDRALEVPLLRLRLWDKAQPHLQHALHEADDLHSSRTVAVEQ